MKLSIENIFKALEVVDSLSADDFDKFKKHLEVIDSKFKKRESDSVGREIPQYDPRPLRSEINSLAIPPDVPAPECSSARFGNIPPPPKPPESRGTCSCSSFFGLIPVHPDKCKCRGNK